MLTVTPGVWSNIPTDFAPQWQQNDGSGWTDLSGETGDTLDTTGFDPCDVRCLVTATNGVGDSDPAASNVVTLTSGTLRVFGNNAVFSDTNTTGSPDRGWGTVFTKTHAGRVTAIYARLSINDGATNYKICAYSVSGGAPAALLWATPGKATGSAVSGVVQFDLPVSGIDGTDAAADYCLVFTQEGYGTNVAIEHDGGATGKTTLLANGTLSYASPPSTWPGTDASYDDQAIGVWCEYLG